MTGLSEVEVSILVKSRILHPIGDPGKNDKKFFSTNELQKLPPDFAHKARKAIRKHWLKKNAGRRNNGSHRFAKTADQNNADLFRETN